MSEPRLATTNAAQAGLAHGRVMGTTLTRALWLTALLSLALRLWIGWAFPITGDEAFFYWWGVFPDWGYYDHPPMVGWWIALMRAIADTTLSIRLPIIAMPLMLGGLLYWGLSGLSRERAAWAVLLFWLAPINWLNTLITTDTPLMFWSLLSVAALMRAEQRPATQSPAWGLYALSGVALGLAFLSKYFSVVLGLCYLVYFAVWRRDRWQALALMVLCALPLALINLAWNISHGWSNIMFNVYNRNAQASFALRQPLMYLGMMAYLITPIGLWLVWRERAALARVLRGTSSSVAVSKAENARTRSERADSAGAENTRADNTRADNTNKLNDSTHTSLAGSPALRLVACLVCVPLVFFALLSLKKTVGLHWVLSFYPLGFVWLAMGLPAQQLKRAALGLAIFSGLHVAAVLGISMTTPEQWASTKLYTNIVRSYKTTELLAQVQALPKPNDQDVVLMSDAYTPASIYGYALGRYVPVFGPGKFHARQDDLLVDYHVFDGKTVRIILSDVPEMSDFSPYFQRVQALQVTQSGVMFHVVEGEQFNFEAYRQGVLGETFKRYYNIPPWLPMTGCNFCVRYCGQVRCPAP